MCWIRLLVILFSARIFYVSAEITEYEYNLMPNIFQYDDYDQCMLRDTNAIYCIIIFQLYSEDPSNTSDVWQVIQKVNSSERYYRHDLLRHGVCVTETCPGTRDDVRNVSAIRDTLTYCYKEKYRNKGLTGEISKMHCETKKSPFQVDNYDIAFGALFVSYVTFVIVATFYVEIVKFRSKTKDQDMCEGSFGKILSSFSLFCNLQRLLYVDFKNENTRSLRSLQGVRFYTFTSIIVVHSCLIMGSSPVSNPIFIEQFPNQLMLFMNNGQIILQIFFLISAFLMTLNILRQCEKNGYININTLLMKFVSRYIRLMPSLAVLLALHSTWIVHLSRGPFWDQLVGAEYRRCRENWWTHLLHINNHVHEDRMCMLHTWYLAADSQYFIMGLIILWLTYNKPTWIYAISGGIIALQALCLFVMTYWNQRGSLTKITTELLYEIRFARTNEWLEMNASTYANISGLAMGLSLAYIFLKYRTKKNPFTKPAFLVLWWTAFIGVYGGLAVFPSMVELSNKFELNPLFAAIYQSISRPLFLLGIILILFGLMNGLRTKPIDEPTATGEMSSQKRSKCNRVEDVFKWLCEVYPVYILGRLTYTAYLIHVTCLGIRMGNRRSLLVLGYGPLVLESIINILVIYAAAAGLTLFVEMPFARLGKQLL